MPAKLIKLTTMFPEWPMQRQTPGNSGHWGGVEFRINKPAAQGCDCWVVYDDLPADETVVCPASQTILITPEPPSVKKYPQGFLDQFTCVVTAHREMQHPNIHFTQQALPWHVGRRCRDHETLGFSKDYDELVGLMNIPKPKELSVICSNQSLTEGHRQRLAFVAKLQEHFGDRLDSFGRGRIPVEDKWDAIAPYEYHIVLENSAVPDYWTEKISDAYLGHAFPFYAGCPNLSEYFPSESFSAINMERPDEAIAVIEKGMADNLATTHRSAVAEARQAVLNRYQLFPMAVELSARLPSQPAQPVTLRPAACFIPRRSLVERAAGWARRRGASILKGA